MGDLINLYRFKYLIFYYNYVNKNISPEQIREYYIKGMYNKKTSSDLLISLIEESPKDDDRTKCLLILGEIGFKTQMIHSLVENLMISDTNEVIHSIAVSIIFKR
jgi:hypothetical protein